MLFCNWIFIQYGHISGKEGAHSPWTSALSESNTTQQNIAMNDNLVKEVVHHEYATIDDIVHITE